MKTIATNVNQTIMATNVNQSVGVRMDREEAEFIANILRPYEKHLAVEHLRIMLLNSDHFTIKIAPHAKAPEKADT